MIISTLLSLFGTNSCRVLITTPERHAKSSLSPSAAATTSVPHHASLDISYEVLHYPAPAQEELQYRDAIMPVMIKTGRRIPFVNLDSTGRTYSRRRKSRDDGFVDNSSTRKPTLVRLVSNTTIHN